VEKIIDIKAASINSLLKILLQDKSSKKNIIWATDTYAEYGEGFLDYEQINAGFLVYHANIIKPRIKKALEAQVDRTRKRAEVFTPAWLCNKMNNHCDEEWFGRKNIFNIENDDNTWTVIDEKIEFDNGTWQEYVDSRRLEITCGEAPYLVSRYDASSGEFIEYTKSRIGILDRKLRIVNENTDDYDTWIKWTLRAFESVYGYEYQGDNLLIARINMLLAFTDYYEERWKREPDDKLLNTVAKRIVWNIWQMDGLKATLPLGKPYKEYYQISFFDNNEDINGKDNKAIICKIYDWRKNSSILFKKLEDIKMGKKMFDYIIGNPPYQEDTEESTRKRPVYNLFMDATYSLANCIELITPARFLFDAGQTPKIWNKQMLEDKHFKVLHYEDDATKIFTNTDIKGGVIISYYNNSKIYKPIEIFTKFDILNSILAKVREQAIDFIDTIVSSRGCYRLTDKFFIDYPNASDSVGKGTGNMLVSNIFLKVPNAFSDTKFKYDKSVKIIGRENNKRTQKYIKAEYIIDNGYINTFNVLISEANNKGEFGETLVEPKVVAPGEGATDTFISIGFFRCEIEAKNTVKYLKSKFCRAMLGVKKATQHTAKSVWAYVPLQDFTSHSDIDWSKSIHEIDLQLYKKYDLDEKEIEFIESHVKEMS
jgi:type II restriction-modification system restriction subunit